MYKRQVLQLFNGATPIATNDDWQFQTVPADVAAIQASGFAPAWGLSGTA